MKIHNFQNSLQASERGTLIIIDYLKRQSHVKSVEDVQDAPEYQQQDIDLIVNYNNNNKQTIEVKIDSYYYKTQNLFWEEISCIETNSIGCFMYSQANLFYYYFYPGDVLYNFNIHEARKWFIANKTRFKQKYIKNKRYDGSLYTSVGRIIPRNIFLNENSVTVTNQIENIF